jgi:(1->4)-alpha-D-glucan 1-alpha-D-glucosylmutase
MVLKIAGPGLPDIYQGAELWDYSFVDPDNRRPVDFAERARHLAELDERFAAAPEALAAELGANPADGRIKLLVMRRLLAARQNDPDLFARGEFRSVSFRGHEAARLAGFARRREERAVLAVVARRPLGLVETGFPTGEAWGDAVLSVPQSVQGAAWTDLLTGRDFPAGGEIGISELFGVLPAAVLVIR